MSNPYIQPMPQQPPVRFIAWLDGYAAFSPNAEVLVAVANRGGLTALPVWEVDYEHQEVVQLLAKREPDGDDWLFLNIDGSIRFLAAPIPLPPTPEDTRQHALLDSLADWAAGYVSMLEPLESHPVPIGAWGPVLERAKAAPESAFYHPLGFALPVHRADGGWMFVWCPEIIATHLAPLSPDDRETLLETIYGRLAWWTELDAEGVPREDREQRLDKRFLNEFDEVPRGWTLANRALLAALDKAANG